MWSVIAPISKTSAFTLRPRRLGKFTVYLLEVRVKSQMNFSSVVLKRMFLEAKVTPPHLNPTHISPRWADITQGLVSPCCIDGPWSVTQRNTAEHVHVWSVWVFTTEQMKGNKTKTGALSNDECEREIKEVAYLSQGHSIDSKADRILDLGNKSSEASKITIHSNIPVIIECYRILNSSSYLACSVLVLCSKTLRKHF